MAPEFGNGLIEGNENFLSLQADRNLQVQGPSITSSTSSSASGAQRECLITWPIKASAPWGKNALNFNKHSILTNKPKHPITK